MTIIYFWTMIQVFAQWFNLTLQERETQTRAGPGGGGGANSPLESIKNLLAFKIWRRKMEKFREGTR